MNQGFLPIDNFTSHFNLLLILFKRRSPAVFTIQYTETSNLQKVTFWESCIQRNILVHSVKVKVILLNVSSNLSFRSNNTFFFCNRFVLGLIIALFDINCLTFFRSPRDNCEMNRLIIIVLVLCITCAVSIYNHYI